jgi:hypothetical protein
LKEIIITLLVVAGLIAWVLLDAILPPVAKRVVNPVKLPNMAYSEVAQAYERFFGEDGGNG